MTSGTTPRPTPVSHAEAAAGAGRHPGQAAVTVIEPPTGRPSLGLGELWALGVGPLGNVGRDDGYYGHRPWDRLTWSLQR